MSRSAESAHEHKWRAVSHVDGCHYFAWAYSCECGATASTHTERDVKADPYSAIWMTREGDEEPCGRCDELMAGAEPKHEVNVVEAGA